MDRDLLYPGQIGLVENTLDAFKSAMVGIAMTSEAVLGQSTQVFGLAAAPLASTAVTGSAFAISLGRGGIFSFQETDPNAYGALGTDTTSILKTGINLTDTSLGITNAAPSPLGYSTNYLVSAQFQELDANPVALPFYNTSGAPTTLEENFTRVQRVVFSVTGGTMAATGAQTTPSAPAGSVPLYVVTISNGQTAVTNGGIAVAPNAPFIINLPSMQASFSTAIAANTTGLAAEVATRTAQAGNLKTTLSVFSNTTLSASQQGSFVEIAAGSAVTVTFPTAIGQAGASWRVFNSSAYTQALKTAGGLFTGPGGNSTATISIGAGQLLELTSDNATWVTSSSGTQMAHYGANQAGSISIATGTSYNVASVGVTFPAYSKSGGFRIRGRAAAAGAMTGTGTLRQNFQTSVSDGFNTVFSGSNWLVTSAYTGDSWGTSDFFESQIIYQPGASVTFTMATQTSGGDAGFTISGSSLSFYVVEA